MSEVKQQLDIALTTNSTDGADDETVIYPRAASRIGRKYQADLPAMDGIRAIENVEELLPMANPVPSHAEPDLPAADAMDEDLSGGRVSPPNAVGAGEYRHRGRVPLWRKRLMMQEEIKEPAGNASDDRRNVDDELVFSLPDDPPNSDIQRFFDDCRKTFAGPNCIDFVDRSMVELHRAGYDVEEATVAVENLTTGDLDLADWTPEEMQLFEAGIAKSGHELYAISKDIPTKRRKDVVRFFYQWKKTPRYVPVYSQYCRKYRPRFVVSHFAHLFQGMKY